MTDQTTNTIKKLGWAEIRLSNNSHTYLNQLVSFTENIIQNSSLKFSKSSSLQNEIVEVSMRAILRYSYDARIFVKYLIKDLVGCHPDIKDFYITPPYIIFHKSNEEREREDFIMIQLNIVEKCTHHGLLSIIIQWIILLYP